MSDSSKRVLERALNAELTEHLGYDKNDPARDNSGNSRNGTTPKTVHTEDGSVGLDVPRDRPGDSRAGDRPEGRHASGGAV